MKYKIIKLLYFKNYSDHHYSLSLLTLAMLVLFSLISSIPFIISSQFDQIVCNQCRNIAYAQNNSENKNSFSNNVTQQWEDKNDNVKVLFAYSPPKPVIDSPTELRFVIQDLKTNKYIKNLSAHVIITTNSSGQERTFRFNNITAPTGSFSLKYLFPDFGTYQIIAAIRSNTSAVALASFQIVVPFEFSNVSSFSALPAGIAIIIVGIVVLAVVIIKTRKPS